jgi:CRISPR-associated protein Csh2
VSEFLTRRREFLFLYDIRMGNPNGDPDENRPRRLPDGTFYVTDVRLKRFVRDWLKTQGDSILVDRPEDAATNLTGRVQHFLNSKPESIRADCEQYQKLQQASKEQAKPAGTKESKPKKVRKVETAPEGELPGDDVTSQDDAKPASADGSGNDTTAGAGTKNSQVKADAGRLVVSIILKSFIDARLFGSSLAFKDWDIEPRPKTLTGAVQINMGEVLHEAHEVDIAGTSTLASKEGNLTGTFTTFFGLRYGLIGFNGIANEHSAKLSHLSDADYERFLEALWRSVASAPTANTRSKMGQVPRVLVDIKYKAGSEFQFGCLLDYAKVVSNGKPEAAIASPGDYHLDLTRLVERLSHPAVETVRYAFHPDMKIDLAKPSEPMEVPPNWEIWDLFGSLSGPFHK